MTALARHDFASILKPSQPPELKQNVIVDIQEAQEQKPEITAYSHNYSYVVKDVRRTIFITFLLVVLNVLFFLILKLKVVSFQGIVF